MKTNLFKITVVAILLIVTAHSCKQENPAPTLPPETQEGKHTFGCYVNGRLFVPVPGAAGFGSPFLISDYYLSTNSLTIIAYGRNEYFNLSILNPEENIKKEIEGIIYSSYRIQNTGEIIFTRFDLDNLIVSGTFSFEIKPYYSITQGRFDIKMYNYNIRE